MISSERLGERLAQARKRLGMNQQDVAERLGLARTTLVAMEKGERRPSNTELLKLAQILALSVNELLREHTVLAEASPRFRMSPQKEPAAEVDQAVELLTRLGRQYVELEHALSITRTTAPLEAITTYHAARVPLGIAPRLLGQEAAVTLRRQMGLGDGPVSHLESLLELEAGLRIFKLPLPSKVAAIFLWSDELGACVALNRHHPEERRRWSLVHELGHFLRDREAGDVLSSAGGSKKDPSEQFSNALATEFLMPATGVSRRFTEHLRDKSAQFPTADLIAMAHFYGVSFQAMTLRLESLELLHRGTYMRLMRHNFRPRTAQEELGLASRPTSAGPWLPTRYERLALEAYSQELLSESELAHYLGRDRTQARDLYLSHQVQAAEGGDLVLELGENVLGVSDAE